ncbi:MAG: glycerol-3-phosphate acyltransferase [Planctomycetaceae bacterium]|nr:glycerol-3-phosphate acyltransferase [Planctomycetaceae bacterium]
MSYAMGCFVTGYYLVRWMTGKDIRCVGSGSAGARNAGRILGQTGFLATLAGDMLKGAAVVGLCQWLETSTTILMLSVLAAAVGHVWPLQLQFRGGKGVAVSIGAIAALDWRIAAGCAIVFAAVWCCSRRYLLSGMISIVLLGAIAAVLWHPMEIWAGTVLLSGLILWAHKEHIVKMISGRTELNTHDFNTRA